MDLGLRGRVAVVAGPAPDAIEQLLASEGVTVVGPDADAGAIDILVTIIDAQGELPLDGTADPLVEAWARASPRPSGTKPCFPACGRAAGAG